MTLRSRLLLVPALAVLSVTGCRHSCCRKSSVVAAPPPPACPTGCGPGAMTPMLGAPLGTTPATPPMGSSEILMPMTPRGTPPAPAADVFGAPAAPAPGAFPTTASPNLSQSAYLSPAAPPAGRARPNEPRVRLLAPELGTTGPTRPVGFRTTPTAPSGLPDFGVALPGRVANGRKPLLDGLDWLQANGYRGAVRLQRPGQSDAADRQQFAQRGLTFAALDVTPDAISAITVERFARLISEPSAQPLYVYDADGRLAGPLWYLYFRQVERLSDDAARIRAGRLGQMTP